MRSAATITGIVWRELVAGLGAALAIGGMDWLSVASHYPLVIIPFATPNNLPWSFLFAPVLAGAMLLTAFAYVWHRWLRQRRRPQHSLYGIRPRHRVITASRRSVGSVAH